ncbi:hypothetical protein A0H81_07716 [Grifola frondosa]|uniref:Uncharacterized protein n=1 Tax=Grifola frondosa TaxID=5627 RepID=A0A1C7M6Y3_GRIFR|nr:hypothetical protein A0H81_07716 [Grifola frondosa]
MLHAFGSTEYLWHQLISDIHLPVDVPHGVLPNALLSDETQQIAIKAIRLDANWRRPSPRIKRTQALLNDMSGMYVDEMQFLSGGNWLLTGQRYRNREGRWYSRLSLWCLEELDNPYVVTGLEMAGVYRSSTLSLTEDDAYATLVLGVCDHEE